MRGAKRARIARNPTVSSNPHQISDMADPGCSEYLPTNSDQADVLALQIAFTQVVKLLSERDPEFKRELSGLIENAIATWRGRRNPIIPANAISREVRSRRRSPVFMPASWIRSSTSGGVGLAWRMNHRPIRRNVRLRLSLRNDSIAVLR